MSGSSDDDRSAAVPSTSKGISTTVFFYVVNRSPTERYNTQEIRFAFVIPKFLMSLILTDSRLQLETLLFLRSQERVLFQLHSTPDNSNLQGKSKKVRVSRSSSCRVTK